MSINFRTKWHKPSEKLLVSPPGIQPKPVTFHLFSRSNSDVLHQNNSTFEQYAVALYVFFLTSLSVTYLGSARQLLLVPRPLQQQVDRVRDDVADKGQSLDGLNGPVQPHVIHHLCNRTTFVKTNRIPNIISLDNVVMWQMTALVFVLGCLG